MKVFLEEQRRIVVGSQGRRRTRHVSYRTLVIEDNGSEDGGRFIAEFGRFNAEEKGDRMRDEG